MDTPQPPEDGWEGLDWGVPSPYPKLEYVRLAHLDEATRAKVLADGFCDKESYDEAAAAGHAQGTD